MLKKLMFVLFLLLLVAVMFQFPIPEVNEGIFKAGFCLF